MISENTKTSKVSTSRFLRWGVLLFIAVVILGVWTFQQSRPWRNTGDAKEGERSVAPSSKSSLGKGLGADTEIARDTVKTLERMKLPGESGEEEEVLQLKDLLSGDAGGLDTTGRVEVLRGMRGALLSDGEREEALAFLAGENLPEGMSRGSIDWISDELLTVLRVQEPAWDGVAGELGEIAFQPGTNPVTRDYIMQHLGHIWEAQGAREEISQALWKGVGTADDMTPGSSLIALDRGYACDGDDKQLLQVREKAFELASNPNSVLAVRVTALSIAGEGGGEEVKKLAERLAGDEGTPVILRKVAEHLLSLSE